MTDFLTTLCIGIKFMCDSQICLFVTNVVNAFAST